MCVRWWCTAFRESLVECSGCLLVKFQARLIHLDCLRWTYRNTSHTPNTIVFSNWISFICVVLSLFLNGATSSSARSSVYLCGGNILFRSIPLKDLYGTGFDTSTVCYTRIPVNCDHSTMRLLAEQFLLPWQNRLTLPLHFPQPRLIFLGPKQSGSVHHQKAYAYLLLDDFWESLDLLAYLSENNQVTYYLNYIERKQSMANLYTT